MSFTTENFEASMFINVIMTSDSREQNLNHIQYPIAMHVYITYVAIIYRIAGNLAGGKFGEFGESFEFRQTKTIQISTYN